MTARKRAARGKTAPARFRRETSAGGVVFRLVNGEPRFLLICDAHGNWGFPKGHVEKGEVPEVAAVREVMEETGLPALTLIESIAPIDWVFRWQGALIRKRCHFFLMATNAERTSPQTDEGIVACEWASESEAMRRITYANARAVLQRARGMVASRAT